MRTHKQQRYDAQFDREIEKAIRDRFTEELLSDAKWVKVIHHMVAHASLFQRVLFKKVTGDAVGILHIDEDTTYEFDFWKQGFEGHNSLGGWLLYREIEYLEFPSQFEANGQLREQDVEGIRAAMDEMGVFWWVEVPGGVRLLGYK